ncbi:MAG: VanZ family protein [Verrucomicrobiota bacterium]|nr:VanZ family protein [Verrucomicrobiota bacterium]
MSKFAGFVKYWLPLLVWMAVIFAASSDTRSFQHSSRIIAPLLRWLFPHIADKTVDLAVFIARKCAHVTEYAVFALLVWRVLRKPARGEPRPWDWRQAGLTLLIVFLYAAGDEFHQRFVPTRTPRVHDVVIDTLGGAAALLALRIIHFRQRHLET